MSGQERGVRAREAAGGAGGDGGAQDARRRDLESVERGLAAAVSSREEGLASAGNVHRGRNDPGGGGGAVNRRTVGAMVPTVRRLLAFAGRCAPSSSWPFSSPQRVP